MAAIVSTNFCHDGFCAIIEKVYSGEIPLEVVVGGGSGCCTNPNEHTSLCIGTFHNQKIIVGNLVIMNILKKI